MKMPPWARAVGAFAVMLAALVLVLVAKVDALALFLAHRAIGTLLALALFAASVLAALRLTRLSGLAVAGLAAPLAFVLVVDLIISPLPYELAHEAGALPHPPGVVIPPYVDTADQFEVNHPSAFVVFDYADGTNVTQLEATAITLFEEDGWVVTAVQLPAAGTPVGSLHLAKGALFGFCTFGSAHGVEMQCALGA
jgi:hypothetical protein